MLRSPRISAVELRRSRPTAILLAITVAMGCDDPSAPSSTAPAALHDLRILFETPAGLLAMNADGSDQELIVSGVGLHSPHVSSDGTLLAYTLAHGDSSDLWVADADGSNRTKLREGHIQDPRWSGDGQHILFTDRNGPHVMSRDGETISDLFENLEPYHAHRWPSWSPDGSRITLEARSDFDDSFSVVMVFNMGAPGSFLLWGAHPVWSSDDRIAYMAGPYGYPETPHDIRIMDPQNPLTAATVLSTPQGQPAQPMDWTPDGTGLLYTGLDSSGNTDLYLLLVDDGTSFRLTEGGMGGPGVFFPE